jgi:hypothetical protein
VLNIVVSPFGDFVELRLLVLHPWYIGRDRMEDLDLRRDIQETKAMMQVVTVKEEKEILTIHVCMLSHSNSKFMGPVNLRID